MHYNLAKFVITVAVLVFGFLILPKTTMAHPGNTDSSGGHYCWTNCTSWGLSYGQYHYHNGTSLPSYNYPTYTAPVYTPPIYVKSFTVFKNVGYNKVVVTGGSSQYLLTYGFGCTSSTFYEGQTMYIDTSYSPSIFDDIYSSTNESSKECSISSSEELSLKAYYVSSVIDSEDKIIVSDISYNEYLVEYGFGCMSMWRYKDKIIYIDIGGSFLDGISDTIYLFDSDDDCRVWDADSLDSNSNYYYTPSPTYTAPVVSAPTVSVVQPIVTLSADKTVLRKGESVLITWTHLNGTTVTSNFGATTLSGSITLKPEVTTTYTITVTNDSSGKTDTKSIIVSVTGIVNGVATNSGTHPTGTVVLGADNKTVYLIAENGKRGFATQVEYASQGYNLKDIVKANSADLQLPDIDIVPFSDGTLVQDTTDGKTVYIIYNGTKRGFVSAIVFTGLGYNFSQAVKGDLSLYPTGLAIGSASHQHPEGSLIKIGTDTYKIGLGGRQLVPNNSVFKSWNWSTTRIVAANESDKSLSIVEPIKYRDGTILKSPSGTIYIVSVGKIRPFTSMSTLLSFGYKETNAINVSSTEISNYVTGDGV